MSDKRVAFRISETMYRKAEKKAKKMNLTHLNGDPNLSEYLRHLVMVDVTVDEMIGKKK